MKPDRLLDAIGQIDDELLVSANRMRTGQKRLEQKRRATMRRRWIQNGVLAAAAAVMILGICFFAARVNREEPFPVKSLEQSVEGRTPVESELPSEEVLPEEYEVTTENVQRAESELPVGREVPAEFTASRDLVVYDPYTLEIRDGVLYAKNSEQEIGAAVNVCEGKLVLQGDTLYYVTWVNQNYHIMKMDLLTFQSQELLSVPPVWRKNSYKPFTLAGLLGDCLIYRVGQCDGGINTDRLYSYHLPDGEAAELAENTSSCLMGSGEYLVSMGYQWEGVLSTDTLTVEKTDGSDSRILSNRSSGGTIKNGILYYLETCLPDEQNDAEGEYLVSYDMDAQKELGRIQLETEWRAENGCFIKYDSFNRRECLLLPDGTIHEYPAGFQFFRLENRYFAATQNRIYQLNPADGSYSELMEFHAEGFTGYDQQISLCEDFVYMDYTTASQEQKTIIWSKSLFKLEEEAEGAQNMSEQEIRYRQLDRIQGEYAVTRILVDNVMYRTEGAETNKLFCLGANESPQSAVISDNVQNPYLIVDETFLYYAQHAETSDDIMKYERKTGTKEILYSIPAVRNEENAGRKTLWIQFSGITDEYLYFCLEMDSEFSLDNELYAVNLTNGNAHVLAKNVQRQILIGDGYVAAFGDTNEVKPVPLYLCASDGSNTRKIADYCKGAVIGANGLQYLDGEDWKGERTWLVSYDPASDSSISRVLLPDGYWSEWNGCFYEAWNHKTIDEDGTQIQLPEHFYPMKLANQMYLYSDQMICRIQGQSEQGIVYEEFMEISGVSEDAEAYQYLFWQQGDRVFLKTPGRWEEPVVFEGIVSEGESRICFRGKPSYQNLLE